MTYELAIIGGGPAGASAAVYAARKRLQTLVITKDWLGQSSVSEKIENWVGIPAISGMDLAKSFENHAKIAGKDTATFKDGEACSKIEQIDSKDGTKVFKITTTDGSGKTNTYEAQTILVVSGSHRRKLDVPGAAKFEHKGLTYCASCDGPLYADQNVAVIGGGNAAFETAAQLLAYCKSVTMLNRSENFRADPGTIETVSKHPKMKVLTSVIPKEVKGDKFVSSIVYTDTKTASDVELPVAGIFVEIGALPNTDFVKGLVELDQIGHIVTNPKDQSSTLTGIWAAGDCTNSLYHQNNIAAGDAVKAVEDIYLHLRAR